MKAAWNRIFKKGLPVLLALLLGWCGTKFLSGWNTLHDQQEYQYLDTWVSECYNMDNQQLEAFLAQISEQLAQLPEKSATRFQMEAEYGKLTSSYLLRLDIMRLTAFAKNKEGSLPIVLPDNYMENLDFYAKLPAPQIINLDSVDQYFELQSFNAVPILVFMLSAVFWGMHYESEIFKYTGTVLKGKCYCRSLRNILSAMCVGALVVNELVDLALSGFLQNTSLWECHVLSYDKFFSAQLDMTLGQLLGVLFASKLLGVLILYRAAELLARYKRNLKDTVVYGIMLLLLLILFTEMLENTDFYSLIQVGIVDWEKIALKAKILPLAVTTLPLGLGLNLLIEGLLVGVSVRLNRAN